MNESTETIPAPALPRAVAAPKPGMLSGLPLPPVTHADLLDYTEWLVLALAPTEGGEQ